MKYKFSLYNFFVKKVLIIIAITFSCLSAQDNLQFITYGKHTHISEGDDNFKQTIFIKIPESVKSEIYLRLFDPDCGGENDQLIAVYNTETRFSLYGRDHILPDENKNSIKQIESKSGEIIYSKTYSYDFQIDNNWETFAQIIKSRGELIDGFYYFKLLVEGIYGNDGNVFDITLSSDPKNNSKISGVEFFTYSPTIQHKKISAIAEAEFYLNKNDDEIFVKNFDMDGAQINLETNLRSNVFLTSSSEGLWTNEKINIQEFEKQNFAAINFGRKGIKTNDVVLQVYDKNSNLIPIKLPIFYKKYNNRPVSKFDITYSENWGEIFLDASTSFDKDNDELSYYWYFGNGDKLTGLKTSYIFSEPGNHEVILLVKDNSGNVANSSISKEIVRLNKTPIAIAGQDTIISSSEFTFDASSSKDIDGKIIEYKWDFGDGSTGKGKIVKHYFNNSGNYKITLFVKDDSGLRNNSASNSFKLRINEKPIADAGIDIISIPNKEITFDGSNSFDPDGEIIKYIWEFSDGTKNEGKLITREFSKPGKYNVSLKVFDNSKNNNAFDIDTKEVITNDIPKIVTTKNIIAAPGDKIFLSSLQSYDINNDKLNAEWDISGINKKFNKDSVTVSFNEAGIYEAILKVSDNSNAENYSQSENISIRINSSPIIKTDDLINTCDQYIYFDASNTVDPDGDPLLFKWNFGDGSSEVLGSTVSHQFKQRGTFPVILTVKDGLALKNSVSEKLITVKINQPPIADAGEDLIICMGEIIPLDAGNSVTNSDALLNYFWDFGDGTMSNDINPVKKYLKSGVYQISLTVKDDSGLICNSDTDTKLVTVVESPLANAGEDKQTCAFQPIQFDGSKSTDSDGIVNSYTWDFGDGNLGSGVNPTHIYTKAGEYKVTLTITGDVNSDCDNSSFDELIVIVNESPIPIFTIPHGAALNEIISFDASKSDGKGNIINNYIWDFGDGIIDTGKIVSHSYSKSGKYFVNLTIETNSTTSCNSAELTNSIIINQSPIAKTGNDTTIFVNQYLQISGLESYDSDGKISKYQWFFGEELLSEGAVFENTFHKSGNYKLKLVVTDNSDLRNNRSEDYINITVKEKLTPIIESINKSSIDENIQISSKFDLVENLSDDQYRWEFGDGNSKTGKVVSHTFNKGGNYNVKLVINFENNIYTTSKNIFVNTPPTIVCNDVYFVCKNEEVTIDASRSYDIEKQKLSFNWEIDNEIKRSGSKLKHTFHKSGIHKIKLTLSDDSKLKNNFSEKEISIFVNSPPIADAGENIKAFTGGAYDQVLFNATNSKDEDNDPLTYKWDFGDGTTGIGPKLFHKYLSVGKYKVTLTVSDNKHNCNKSTDEIFVTILKR